MPEIYIVTNGNPMINCDLTTVTNGQYGITPNFANSFVKIAKFSIFWQLLEMNQEFLVEYASYGHINIKNAILQYHIAYQNNGTFV